MTSPSSLTRAWVIWSIGVTAYILAVANRTSLMAVGVDAADRFQADASTLSMFAVLQLAVYGFMQIPVGVMLDRYGVRPIMVVGMVLMAIGQLVMALSLNVGVAITARMLLGAGDAAVFPSVLRLVALWFPARLVPPLVQFSGIIGSAGQLISTFPLPAMVHATSWSVAFGSIAGLCVLFGILVALIVRNAPAEMPPSTPDTEVAANDQGPPLTELDLGIRAAWAHPGTRLAFWTHHTASFAGVAFTMLWGIPYLTVGEGMTQTGAAALMTFSMVVGMVLGPVIGVFSSRIPERRSAALVLPPIAAQLVSWLAIILWPGPAPLWLLITLAAALAIGGAASMIAFDHARTYNPRQRLSTANGLTNVGGFLAGLISILLIGVALDLQGAGTPETYTLEAFRIAFLVQVPLFVIGGLYIVIEERKAARNGPVQVGSSQPR